MDEYDEPSDVEMVPIEELEGSRTVPRPEPPIPIESIPERPEDTFTTGIDIFSKEEKLKMEERAKRFGLTEKDKEPSNLEENLYSSMGIVDDGENAKNIRMNVIHMRGTEDMSTKDVFKYFQDYAPTSIEWINDISCNVVWFDNVTAARAMLGLSRKIVGSVARYSDRENDSENRKDDIVIDGENESIETNENEKKNDCISIKDIDYPLPPGIWRKGIDYPKSKGIFLRFATRADKKQVNAEKRSEYYKKYGNPNFGGLKGILTESRKRMYKQTKQTKRKSLIEEKNHDQTKNPWGALSETWGLNDIVEDDFLPKNGAKDQGRSVKERLGLKCEEKDIVQEAEESSDASLSSDSDENWCKRSKVPRMRMHADDEEEKVQKRRAKLRFQMILNNLNNCGDLRSKLGKSKTKTQYHEPIQVVVTNANATNSKRDKSGIIRQKGHQKEVQSLEKEEGEWQESEEEHEEEKEEHGQHSLINAEEEREGEEEEEEEEEGERKEDEEDSSEEDNDVLAKEIQGPKGSVIKVVPPKPRIASTVWARLNHVKSEASDSYLKKRSSRNRDLRNTLKSGDLRSRIGNHTRGRSPLRIEVKNDKYTKDNSDGE